MLKLIIRQANWGVLGAIFAFTVGFFVKIYVIDAVGLEEWGKYVIAHTFSSFSETFLSIGIPFVILKFLPSLIDKDIDKASRVASIFLKYALVIGLGYVIIIYFTSDIINRYIYNDIIIEEKETIYIEIPIGIDDNEIILLKEKGNIYRSLEDYNKNYNLIDRYNKNNGVTILKHLKDLIPHYLYQKYSLNPTKQHQHNYTLIKNLKEAKKY